jgi:hypothetical protein
VDALVNTEALLLARAEIHDVIVRYFVSLDRGEREPVRRCFTEDVIATYEAAPAMRGVQAVMTYLERHFAGLESGERLVSMHFMGALAYEHIDEANAETETQAVAWMGRPAQPANLIAVRGLRYLDRFHRTKDGWRICERRHTLDWASEIPASHSLVQAARVMRLDIAGRRRARS